MSDNVVKWAAIYPDLSTFTNLDGTWEDAPAWGMQAVVYASKETGWSICVGGNYIHRLPDGEFIPMDKDGLVDRAANEWEKIKVGRQLSRPEFNKVMKLVVDIMGAENKTAHFRNERRE